MFRSTIQLGLPRKIVSYYLLFCVVALTWLAVGMLLTSHSLLGSRTTSACFARLGKTAAALELAYVRGGVDQLQPVLQDAFATAGLQHCEVVSYEGTVLAHSDATQVGQSAVEPQGSQLQWGSVTGIQYETAQGHTISEYRVPLATEEERFGTLRIAVRELDHWSTLTEIAGVLPLLVLMPLGLIALGAVFIARLSQPISQIENQLSNLARQRPTAPLELTSLTAKSASTIGWNRVVEALGQGPSASENEGLESRLAEVIASRSQNQLQDVLHNLTDGIAVTDVEGRITFANRAVAALLGTETTDQQLAGIELEGKILQAVGGAADEPLFAGAVPQRPAIAEFSSAAGADGRTLRVARLPLAGEVAHGHVWSVRDVTQQKLAEQSRDQFIDAATHELRTPLSNIKAYAETLATCDTIELEEQKEFCNIINSEVTRLARFVDDLLSISSMEAGSLVIDRQRTISARLFEEVLAKVQPLMRQKDIDFVVDLPEKMADLEVDKDKIVAVVVNLLGNAAKYTPSEGRVSLRVMLDEQQLQIAVEDTGVGIAAEELTKVFDKFFRSADPRVQSETGTGLGLALAREVIRLHGGDIAVESKIDQGTTFTATLPLR